MEQIMLLETKKEVKGRGIIAYLKHAFLGAVVAVMSFTAVLAAQPEFAEEGLSGIPVITIEDATQADLNTLLPYMDAGFVSSMEDEKPADIIKAYMLEDEAFAQVANEYFQ